MVAEASAHGEALALRHDRLDSHFRILREQRDARGASFPIFALEHGLIDAELQLLKSEVCSSVRCGLLPREKWLPLVVYATEIGYEYSGEEYWQTFESRTPGWTQHGDRHFIRRCFQQFSERFSGARPSGAWADWFSIISWPITHAVLPTDLQRHLARLLFEYRSGLTSDLLHDPAELGRRLAARAWNTSSRFRNFAQNTELLGQVAAALLSGDDEESPYLLDSTYKRIVADLSQEREARRWLRDAKVTASRVRARGLGVVTPSETRGGRDTAKERLPAATDPEILLQRDSAGWTAFLEIPDLTSLAERLPSVHEELGRLRASVAGVKGPPLARGRVLVPGQRIRLDEWPNPHEPLITLEEGSLEANQLLADQCVLPAGPTWLFRLANESRAVEVHGLLVRPGRSYLLVSQDELAPEMPPWIEQVSMNTKRAHGYRLDTPSSLEGEDLQLLGEIGVAAATNICVRPVGFVAALWDGEGTAEWNVGEEPIIALSSSRAVERCVFALDGEPEIMRWPNDEGELFIRMNGLDVGTHDLQVALVAPDHEGPIAEGLLRVIVRTPPSQRSTGTYRQGLMLLPTPISPTLAEVWNGKATLEIRGPEGAEVKLSVCLGDRNGNSLARQGLHASLPVDGQYWLSLWRQIHKAKAIQQVYEESDSCSIEVSHPELGSASLRCEREFTPLRWVFRRNSDGPFVRLIDNTDGMTTAVDYYTFDTPDRPERVNLLDGMEGRWPCGGLVTATSAISQASVILPPAVRRLEDLRVAPKLERGPRSLETVSRLMNLVDRWARAPLPADPFVAHHRIKVLRAITAYLAGLIGGERWEWIEQMYLDERRQPSASDLREAIGTHPYQRELALDLSRRLDRLKALSPLGRVAPFAFALQMHPPPTGMKDPAARFSEFLLRLTSDPASLLSWSTEDRDHALERAMDTPAYVRAARYIVLSVDQDAEDSFGATYAGWAWE